MIRLRQGLVEHRARKMQTVMRTTELSVHDWQELQQRRDDYLVEGRLDGHLIGIVRNYRQREFVDRHRDARDVTLEEIPADVGRQVIDHELKQAAVGSLEQLDVDVEHGQREVAHRDVEELTERRARHRREAEQPEGGQPLPAAYMDAEADGI